MSINMHDVELALIEVRAALFERLATIKQQLHSAHSTDAEEQSQEREDDGMLHSLEAETQQEIAQVSKALTRIVSGEYGSCESCGAVIDERRLNAIPYATLCISCAVRH
ncbi:MAG TPA: TraR/DksA family transcriptional regulator [Pseudomonadales bacterium]|nr:TraR/DksA family transcriptional regulator [Pseudomonadales bacterium]